MARIGLGEMFECVFANDIDPMKCAAYRENFPGDELLQSDIWDLAPKKLPPAQLAWASFPCQDLSLAGNRRGLSAPRSGAFWGFWNIIEALKRGAPGTLVLENVPGLLSSHKGSDFLTLIATVAEAGYRVGAVQIDAALFSPQSRQRLFIIAHKGPIPETLLASEPDPLFHSSALRAAVGALPAKARMAWIWWRLPHPPLRNLDLASLLERSPPEACWRSEEDTKRLLGQMAPLHRERVHRALSDPDWQVGAVFRRIRLENGARVQRAEIRYDGVAGCLRTPSGGSSKQLLLVTENGRARLRPLLAREAARLMGLDDAYRLPASETAALKIAGDGVSVPVVRWLGRTLLAELLSEAQQKAVA